jgi:hypothetical protein
MKILAAVGIFLCIAFGGVGVALGGVEGMWLLLGVCGLGLVACAYLLEPSRWVEPTAAVDERGFLAKLVMKAILLRCLVSVFLHITGAYDYLGGDEGTFDANGQIFCLWLQKLLPFSLGQRLAGRDEVGYPYLVGAIYYTFGVSKFLPLLLNCVIGGCLVYPVHALAGRFGGRDAARRAAVLVAYFPSLVLWSALMVRDVWALMGIMGALYFGDRLRREFRVRHLIAAVACLALLAVVRGYLLYIVGAGYVLTFLLRRSSVPRTLFVGGLLMVGVMLAVRSDVLPAYSLGQLDLQSMADMRRYNAMGPNPQASLGTDVDISTPMGALSYLPLGLLYFYLSPLPWQIGSPRQFMAIVDLVVWYSMLPAAVVGLVWLVRHRARSVFPLVFAVIGISVLHGLVEGNIGIIFRHRAQIIVPLAVMAGVGYAVRKRAQARENRALEGPVPVHAAARGALGPSPGLRVPAGAP